MYDAKSKTALTKKTSSNLGRVLHDDPIMAARKKQDDDRRNSPRAKLLEKHAAEVQALQRDHVSFARTLADDHKVEESEIRRRSPNEEFKLGTIQHKRLAEMKAQRDRTNAVFKRDMEELKERHAKELERLERRGTL